MRSQALLQPARSLAKKRATSTATRAQRILHSASGSLGFLPSSSLSRAPRPPSRKDSTRPPARVAAPRTSRRRASSSSAPSTSSLPVDSPNEGLVAATRGPPEEPNPTPPENEADLETEADAGAEAETLKSSPVETGEKTKRTRRPRVVEISSKDEDSPSLPTELEVLWTPDASDPPPSLSAIPPPEIFNKALVNLLITLHPQTQNRAAYPSANGPPIEPTLGLYCPIEGGDYVIDETVRELARRTDSDVIVLDSVQLAAGEWGAFGKGAFDDMSL